MINDNFRPSPTPAYPHNDANDPQRHRMFSRIFGLVGHWSYRKLRLGLLCCHHRLS
jgi:hypothetical protein